MICLRPLALLLCLLPQISSALPNILLIVSEDNGPELGCYDEPHVRTPVLDQLAADGVRFENAFVPYSVCSPSRACFLTGLHPHQNGQLGLATHRFAMFEKWPNLFSILREAGYATGLIGKLHVNPESAFLPHLDHREISGANFGKRNVRDYADSAARFFKAAGDRPFVLSINYPDAHFPLLAQQFGIPEKPLTGEDVETIGWIGADSPRLREATANYYNCLERLDTGIGMLLAELESSGKAEDTLVLYIGDHGGQFSRGKTSCHEAGMRVPLIASGAGVTGIGEVREELASTLDLLPTICAAAGVDAPANHAGHDLGPLLRGEASPPDWRSYTFGVSTGAAPAIACFQLTVRGERYRMILNPLAGNGEQNRSAHAYLHQFNAHFIAGTTQEEIDAAPAHVRAAYARYLDPVPVELYDLENDPHEWHNLADDPAHAEARSRLMKAYADWSRETGNPFLDPAAAKAFHAEQLEAIEKDYRKAKSFRWPYLTSLHPNRAIDTTVFEHRPIPEGTPLEGEHASAKVYGYRIPSLLVTAEGSVLSFSERRLGLGDHAQNDIVLRRSTDGGRTFGKEIVVHEDGMNSINDPLTVQLENGRIVLVFARFPYGRHSRAHGWIRQAEAGYANPDLNVLTHAMHSDDNGLNWSEPVDISQQVKPPHWINANTPGAMIQIQKGPHKGRVVTGLWGSLTVGDGDGGRTWEILAAYSDDGGETWSRSESLVDRTGKGYPNECQVAEAANGDLVLIARNQGGATFRKKAFSKDGGESWSEIEIDKGLPSVACMGSIIRGPEKADGSWDLYASFPSAAGRKNGQIVVSEDNGKTWEIRKIIPGAFAYSCLQIAPGGDSLLLAYEAEGYRRTRLLSLSLEDLEEP